MLCSDLVGFHTYDYARHFLQSCAYLLDGIELSANGIYRNTHHTVVGAFPVGIEPEKFEKQLQTPETQTRVRFPTPLDSTACRQLAPPNLCFCEPDQRADEII
jgi:trehalose-6-phosphate synthase